MNKNLTPKEDSHPHRTSRPRENPEEGINLSGMIDTIRARIEDLSETNRSFGMLRQILDLLAKAPKRLMPVYLATALTLLSACSSGELINRERRMSGLSISKNIESKFDTATNPISQAAKKRLEEILEFAATAEGKKRSHILENREGKGITRIIISDKESSVVVSEGIDFIEETKTPILWIKNTSGENMNLEGIVFRENGLPRFKRIEATNEATSIFYDTAGKPLARAETINLHGKTIVKNRKMYKLDGDTFGTLKDEREKNQSLRAEEYLKMLARELNTPERIATFLMGFMKYTHDSSDPMNRLSKGTEEDRGEYWQTANETVTRIENGFMLGDCEDYSFLAREILRRQGKLAHVIHTPGHATCIWLDQRNDKKYNAYSLSSEGFGNNKKMLKFGEYNIESVEGYSTAKKAVEAILKKYDVEIEDTVTILELINGAEAVFEEVPIEAFLEERKYLESIKTTRDYRRKK